MISRYEVKLNDKSLESLITRKVEYINDKGKKATRTEYPLLVLDVAYSGTQYQVKEQTVAGLDGYDVAETYAQKQTVAVTFELHLYDTAERNAACQKVIAWAKDGGELKINDRANQHLQVRCETFPVISSVKHWTDPLTIVFATVAVPYWRNDKMDTLSLSSGTSSTGYLTMTGNPPLKTLVNADIKSTTGTVTSLQIACGSTKLVLKGFSLKKNEIMNIRYTNDRYLSIKVGNTSFMKYLQSNSSDMLLASCGSKGYNKITVTADKKVSSSFSAEGLWL